MVYELWNTRSRNMVASFETEEAALTFVRDTVRELGIDGVVRLALAREDDAGRVETIALGHDLAQRAQEGQHAPRTAPSAMARPA